MRNPKKPHAGPELDKNAKLTAAARARILELYPTCSLETIRQKLLSEGYLPAGVTISKQSIFRFVAKVKQEREEALKQHREMVQKTLAEQVMPHMASDLSAMGDLAERCVRLGDEIYALANETITLYCETEAPERLPDGTVVRRLMLNPETQKPMLRMPRDLKAEIDARAFKLKGLVAAANTYRLSTMIRLSSLQAAGLAPVETGSVPVVVLPTIDEVPDEP